MDQGLEKSWIVYSEKCSWKGIFIKKIIRHGRVLLSGKGLEETRRLWDREASRQKTPADMLIEKIELGGVSCEWIIPKEVKGDKILVYLHGGGYVLGNINTARIFGIKLARYTGQKVLTVDYRLAPENKFPAALEDSLSVYRSLLTQEINSDRIVMVGDSAGGGLSLATILTIKNNKEPLPSALVCLSPWTDLAATGESNRLNSAKDPIFGKGSGVIRAEDYAGEESLYNPLISPLYGDFNDFPPLFIHVGTDEVILDDSIRVAEKVRAAGSKVALKVWKGMWHVFTTQESLLPEAKQSLKEIAEFIKSL